MIDRRLEVIAENLDVQKLAIWLMWVEYKVVPVFGM